MNAHIPELPDRPRAVLLDDVCHRNHTDIPVIPQEAEWGFPLVCKLLCLLLYFIRKCRAAADIRNTSTGKMYPLADSRQTVSRKCLKCTDFLRAYTFLGSIVKNSSRQRMLTHLLQMECIRQKLPFCHVLCRQKIRNLRFALSDRSCLIQCHDCCLAGFFHRNCRFKQNAVSGSHTISYHDRHRCGKPQSTRAADHQNGNSSCQRKTDILSKQKPDKDRDHCDRNNCRHKYTGNLICYFGDRCLCCRRITDHLDDLGQCGILSHSGGLTAKHTGLIDGCSRYAVSLRLIHR